MKFNFKIILSALILVAALTIVVLKLLPNDETATVPNDVSYTRNSKRAEGKSDHSPKGEAQNHSGAGAGKSERSDATEGDAAQKKAAIITKIQTAATTYNAANLPIIQPYLVDPDPEIRKEALNGMLVLGESAAGPMLRDAAKQMTSDLEAKALLDAAKFIELPPVDVNELIKRSREPKANVTPANPK